MRRLQRERFLESGDSDQPDMPAIPANEGLVMFPSGLRHTLAINVISMITKERA